MAKYTEDAMEIKGRLVGIAELFEVLSRRNDYGTRYFSPSQTQPSLHFWPEKNERQLEFRVPYTNNTVSIDARFFDAAKGHAKAHNPEWRPLMEETEEYLRQCQPDINRYRSPAKLEIAA